MRGRALHLVGLATVLVAGAAVGMLATGDPPLPTDDHEDQTRADAQETHEHQRGEDETLKEPEPSYQQRHEHPFPDRATDADRPTRAEASELEHQFRRFIVHGDEGLEEMRKDGHLLGNGTLQDPYVIQEFRVTDRLEIKDTTKPLVIEESYIEGQLVLNFVGPDLHVHHNHIEDLRVNENVERNERATSGLIEDNEIPYIGQLRHFSGELAHNEIGPKPNDAVSEYLSDTGVTTLPEHVTFLLDGYHQAHVHNNSIQGHTEIKLHGHYHGSCYACPPHDHADPDGFPPGNQPHEDLEPSSHHSYRYHALDFENNTIHAEDAPTALRVHDTQHAGDDQTANSEPNAHLEERHDHHQAVRIAGNTLEGSGLLLDVVNAKHERHENMTQQAAIQLEENKATLHEVPAHGFHAAYDVQQARETRLEAHGNTFVFEEDDSLFPEPVGSSQTSETTGILLEALNASTVWINETRGQGSHYGVTESHITPDTRIGLTDNQFDARKEDHHER